MNQDLIVLFTNAKAAVIVVPKTAKLDSLAAALALQLAFASRGKNAQVCSEVTVSQANQLVGSGQISPTLELGGNTLKVSFPYQDGAIDKVTYNITDERFNLLIEPRSGQAPIKNKDVQFSYTGAETDIIITIDTPSLEALGDIYLENPDVFLRDKIVNIDRRFDNQQYGAFNLVEKKFSSTCEIIIKLLESLRWDLNPDMATNLYAGLVTSTNNFSSFSTNAQSFEAASYLLKNGARKVPLGSQRMSPPSGMASTLPSSRVAIPPAGQNVFQRQEEVVKPQQTSQQLPKQPPQDWLKPKIFKSTDSI